MGQETNISAHQMGAGGSPKFGAVHSLPPVLLFVGLAAGKEKSRLCGLVGYVCRGGGVPLRRGGVPPESSLSVVVTTTQQAAAIHLVCPGWVDTGAGGCPCGGGCPTKSRQRHRRCWWGRSLNPAAPATVGRAGCTGRVGAA